MVNGGTGYDEQAMEHLGHAVHTATDATSPQHAGYQPWYGQNDWFGAGAHYKAEKRSGTSSDISDEEARYLAHVEAQIIHARFNAGVQEQLRRKRREKQKQKQREGKLPSKKKKEPKDTD